VQKFEFRLARVLRLREAKLRTEEFTLQQTRARLSEVQAELDALKRAAENAGQEVKAETWVRAADLSNLQHYAKRLEREAKECSARIASQEEVVKKQAAVVMDAQREVSLLEKLREKQRLEWKIEADREAENIVGDFLAAQWARRQNDTG
jgi:flagellar export protein FliJ